MVSFGSLIAFEIHFPISCMVYMASLFHVSDFSIAIGANMCVEVMVIYCMRSAALFAEVPARIDVSLRCDLVNVSGTVRSQASGLPRDNGMSVEPSGCFPSILVKPTGSLVTGI